jgi:hypothetical protein
VVAGALRLMGLSIVPMLVLLVPTCLLLSQLALWYQARPLAIDEETVLTVELASNADEALGSVRLSPHSAVNILAGPVRVPSKHLVCWSLRTTKPGCHRLSLQLGDASVEKELAVGDGYMPVSLRRPAWNWHDVLLHPHERPFAAASPVKSIELSYPPRPSRMAGSDTWLIYWFAFAMVAAFAVRPVLKVNL